MKFPKLRTGDRVMDGIQDNVERALAPLSCPLLDGRQVDNVLFTSGAGTRVAHGLGRKPRGWFLVGIDGEGRVWEHELGPTFLILSASMHATGSIWTY